MVPIYQPIRMGWRLYESEMLGCTRAVFLTAQASQSIARCPTGDKQDTYMEGVLLTVALGEEDREGRAYEPDAVDAKRVQARRSIFTFCI